MNQPMLRSEASLIESARPDDCWDTSHEHPPFTCPPGKHFGKFLTHNVEGFASPRCFKVSPPHGKELEWLEAF